MKKIAGIFLCFLLTILCFDASARRVPGDKVGVKFPELIYEFGNVKESGAPVVHEFTYTNTGSGAVAILSARASCGCTEPQYNRKPLAPGESGKLKVKFMPQGQRGEVSKDVRIKFKSTNGATEQVTVRLVGVVLPE